MAKIEQTITINGYAWIEEDTDELIWAYQDELQDIRPQDRPNGCTPVVIEISPAEEWLNRKQHEQEYLGDISERLASFKEELLKVQRDLKVDS